MMPAPIWHSASPATPEAPAGLIEIGADWHFSHRELSDERRDQAVRYIVAIVTKSTDLGSVDLAARQLWHTFRVAFDESRAKDSEAITFARAMRLL